MSYAKRAGLSVGRTIPAADLIREVQSRTDIVNLPISDVVPADSPPRTAGVNLNHVHTLAETATALPPIIVHRATMQVVDGWHRLRAAISRGEATIAAVFFDGDPEEAFVLAVKMNAAQGLPLSLADRRSAALRILLSYPDWSDRAIAEIAGISHPTVAAIRRQSTGKSFQSTDRIARNGVLHRTNGQQGRTRAAELFTAEPDASARKVALAAGISVTTAKDVRQQLRAGMQQASSSMPAIDEAATVEPAREPARNVRMPAPKAISGAEMLQRLRKDPSLRFTETGRKLLRWLEIPFGDGVDWNTVVRGLPNHCGRTIAELARERSREWQQLANLLDQHAEIAPSAAEPTAKD